MGNYLWRRPSGQDDVDGYRDEDVVYYAKPVVSHTDTGTQTMGKLKKHIEGFAKGATVEYIGKTSGNNAISAMKSRVDEYKRDNLHINEMRLLYETSSEDDAYKVESELVNYSQNFHKDINKNRVSGGGGRSSSASKQFVYVAYRRS